MTDEQWSSVLDVTLTGTLRCTRAALRILGPQGSGVVVNNASVLGWRAQAGQAHYAAAKAGVMGLTRSAAIEAAPFGVRVNAVAPSLAMHPADQIVGARRNCATAQVRSCSGGNDLLANGDLARCIRRYVITRDCCWPWRFGPIRLLRRRRARCEQGDERCGEQKGTHAVLQMMG
jgi:NAD(P)-dependent dehydrogenase (short-subunit alcohol dehydrogenase family)